MNRQRKPPRKGDAELFFGNPTSRSHERKDQQLCEQVHQAISLALAEFDDETLADLRVASVLPNPHIGRLQVQLEALPGTDVQNVQSRLARASGRLRSEVASSIHRKKVPTLSFCIVPSLEDGADG